MNKTRREKIRKAIEFLESAYSIVDTCKDLEEDSLSNLEGISLENTERYEKIKQSCWYLNDAVYDIERTKDNLYNAMNPWSF